jgi:glycosidase
MGVTILWLSPIQETNTFGYDVSNFVKIKDDYGNSEKFKSLLALAESMGQSS